MEFIIINKENFLLKEPIGRKKHSWNPSIFKTNLCEDGILLNNV